MRIPTPRQLPSGMWFIQLRIAGDSISITQDSPEKCEAEARAIKTGVMRRERKPRDTLRDATNDYLRNHQKKLSESTVKAYKSYQKVHMQSVMDKPMSKVNWQKQIDDMEGSAKTKKNVWYFFHAAMSEKGFNVNVELPSVKKHPMPWLTPEQIPVFVDAIKGDPCELPALLGLHGLRRSEMFALTPKHIDLKNNIIHVRGARINGENEVLVDREQNKTSNSTRDVPIMIPRLTDLLKNIEPDADYLLTERIHRPYNRINAICEKNGLPRVGVHGLRRSFASLGYHLGMSEMEIMSIGGWDDWQTVHQFYLYLSEQDRLRAANKMSEFYNANVNC